MSVLSQLHKAQKTLQQLGGTRGKVVRFRSDENSGDVEAILDAVDGGRERD